MQAVPGVITIPASTSRLIFSIPIKQLHNVVLKAVGACSIGGADVQTDTGLPMDAGDVVSWNWQDFRQDETEELKLYGIAAVETKISYLIWKR